METAKSRNSKLTGRIEFLTVETKCCQCGKPYWGKKPPTPNGNLCFNCTKENIAKLLEQNKDNL